MNIPMLLGSVAVGYLLGAVSFDRVIGRIVIPDEDLTSMDVDIEGTDRKFKAIAISASVIRKKAGARYSCLTGILDMLKAFVPALILQTLFPTEPYSLFAAASAVWGRNFPVYHRFKGGRGISPTYGGLLVIERTIIAFIRARIRRGDSTRGCGKSDRNG